MPVRRAPSGRRTSAPTSPTRALKDVRLRQAIAYALDRKRIVDDVYRGVGYPIVLPWPKYSPAYDRRPNEPFTRNVEQGQGAGQGGRRRSRRSRWSTRPPTPTTRRSPRSCRPTSPRSASRSSSSRTRTPTHIQKLIGGKFPGSGSSTTRTRSRRRRRSAVTAYPFNADKNSSNFVNADVQEGRRRGVDGPRRPERPTRSRPTTRSATTCSTASS